MSWFVITVPAKLCQLPIDEKKFVPPELLVCAITSPLSLKSTNLVSPPLVFPGRVTDNPEKAKFPALCDIQSVHVSLRIWFVSCAAKLHVYKLLPYTVWLGQFRNALVLPRKFDAVTLGLGGTGKLWSINEAVAPLGPDAGT